MGGIKVTLFLLGSVFVSGLVVIGFCSMFDFSTDIDDISGYIGVLGVIVIIFGGYVYEKFQNMKYRIEELEESVKNLKEGKCYSKTLNT